MKLPSPVARLVHRAEATTLAAALKLPEPVQRRLVGRPVVVDGLTLSTDTQVTLALQRLVCEPGTETLPIPEGRRALLRHTALTGGRLPIDTVRAVRAGDLPARLYVPTGAPASGPLLMFLHGGGFMYGDLDTHDPACRFLAENSGVRLLAIDYRLGPEHRFPAAYDDALAAYRWALDHADDLGADRTRIGVGGDSAGGNLAAGVAIEAARAGLPCAVQLLVYPATDSPRSTPSGELFAEGFYLTKAFMDLADRSYARSEADLADPRYSPARADLPRGLAPALVFTAGFDPLRDEGEAYAKKLAGAGVEVKLTRFDDQIHGFFNIVAVGRSSRAANAEIAAALRSALAVD